MKPSQLQVGDIFELTESMVFYPIERRDDGRWYRDLTDRRALPAYLGRYVVTNTNMTGGGTAHGPHDVYPDGWQVSARTLDGERRIQFYQSGCFTAINRNVPVSGKAQCEWREVWSHAMDANAPCRCGHPYHEHFDVSTDGDRIPVGCANCECRAFLIRHTP